MKKSFQNQADNMLENIAGLVETSGWAVVYVGGDKDSPPFSYTVGLTKKGLPELIAFALPPEAAKLILNNAATQMLEHGVFSEADLLDKIVQGLSLCVKAIPDERARGYLNIADQFFGEKLRVMQLIWPDRAQKFPWQDGFDSTLLGHQPILSKVH